MSKNKRIAPNVIRGGVAIPLKSNYFYMNGKKHEQGGIDIGKDLEVEDGEIIKIENDGIKVLSNAPIMNGVSPAQMALDGLQDGTFESRFKQGFKYQEKYKDVNGLKDDGTKAKYGKKKKVIEEDEENIEFKLGELNTPFYKPKKQKETKIEPPLKIGQKHLKQRDYIGGTPNEARIKAFNMMPKIKKHIEELAKIYGIDKNVLTHRFLREGWVDDAIKEYNSHTSLGQKNFFNKAVNRWVDGYFHMGLDDAGTHLAEGKYNLRREIPYYTTDGINEKDRPITSISLDNLYDALEIKAADMEYRQNELRKRGISKEDMNTYLNAAYNLGLYHKDLDNADWVKKNYTVPNYFKLGGKTNMKQRKQTIPSTGEIKKAELGEAMRVDENGRLIDDIEPAVVTARKPLNEIVQSELVRRILLDKIKLFDDEKIQTYKINTKLDTKDIVRKKAELGTTETKKETIADIVEKVIKSNEAENAKLAARISSPKLPLSNNKIDSRALFKGSSSSSSNTKRLAPATVTATKKSLPSLISKAVTKDPGIAKPKSSTITKSSSTTKGSTTSKPTIVVKKDIKKPATLLTKSELDKVRSRNISSSKLPEVKKSSKIINEGVLKSSTKPRPSNTDLSISASNKLKSVASSIKATTNNDSGLATPKRNIGKRIETIDSSKLLNNERSGLKTKSSKVLLEDKDSGLATPKGYYKDEKGNIKRSINLSTPIKSDRKTKSRIRNNDEELNTESFSKTSKSLEKSSNISTNNQNDDLDFTLNTKNNNRENKVSYLQANPTFLPNLISAGINVIGSGISYGINKKFLDELKAPKAPYLLQPTKLKTRINIKPQINELKRTINRYNKYFDQNTASSQTAVGRRLLNEQTYIDNYNQLYGAKENQETQLINQDRLQQHETAKYNLTNYNNWLREKTNFENSVREKKSENAQMLTQNIAGSLTNFLDKQAQWKESMANIAALSAAYPDVTPEYMAEQGLPYALWLKQKREKRNNS